MHSSLIPAQGFPGALAALAPAAGAGAAPESAGLVKNVVAVKIPETVVPGRTGYFVPLALSGASNDRSPTLIIRDRRPSRPKKSKTLKYGPSACISNGIS